MLPQILVRGCQLSSMNDDRPLEVRGQIEAIEVGTPIGFHQIGHHPAEPETEESGRLPRKLAREVIHRHDGRAAPRDPGADRADS